MRRLAVLILSSIVSIACHLAPRAPSVAAASQGDVAAMKKLLDTGLDPNARDATGYTPLISAARAGNVSMIRLLTSRGADPNLRDAAVNSWTPLLHAVHKGQPGSIAALLDAGADANGTDSYGTTPLMMAAGYGYTDNRPDSPRPRRESPSADARRHYRDRSGPLRRPRHRPFHGVRLPGRYGEGASGCRSEASGSHRKPARDRAPADEDEKVRGVRRSRLRKVNDAWQVFERAVAGYDVGISRVAGREHERVCH